MSEDALLDLWRSALTVAAQVSAPFLVIGLVIGLVIAIVQTATQLQESALTFVPKLAVALVVLALAGHWMLDKLGHFAITSFQSTATQPMQIAPELHTPGGG
ncbi:MAG: flagellar biosynthetic protein FliQ [Kofleriaceae bacterium]